MATLSNIEMHYRGEEEFVKRMMDICENVERKQSFYVTEFLNPYQIEIVESVGNSYDDLKVETYGGIVNCEMARAIIAPEYFEIEKDDFKVGVYEIIYPTKFEKVKHSDVLGALTHLGIKRELFGDIVVNERVFFACDSTLEYLLQDEMTSVRHARIRIKKTEEEIEAHQEYTVKTFFVSSLRLDVLLSHFYKVSRSEVNKFIIAGFVKVNHKVIVENSFLCNNNDIISFKKHGRVKVVDTNRISKGNNHVIEGYFYK